MEFMLRSEEYRLQGIGQLFVLEKLLKKNEAVEFYKRAVAENSSLVHYLVKNNILSALQIAHTVASSFGVPLLDIDCIDVDTLPLHLINQKLICQHLMIPLFCRGPNLYLATEDPSKQSSLKEIQFHTGLNTHAIVVEVDKLNELIKRLLSIKETQELSEYIDNHHDADILMMNEEHDITTPSISVIDDAPIVKFVNKILLDAIKRAASDIHFETYEKEYRIRYRQDGILHEVAKPPASRSTRITARIKVMAKLDISERRMPQDGGFTMQLDRSNSIDFRVSTCPTTNGEKVVIRILDPNSTKIGIDALGFNTIQKEQFIRSIKRPQGMILVTGPTGCGKTVTLYTALELLNTKEVNISTAEDPVEIKVSGINQVHINPKTGLTFSSVLRSLLRQDPDIIMLGEIRDLETAEIAIKAAQTGHLVLSTLHTNSATETLNRLVSMGLPTFNIANSVTLIIAQRLARKLCEHCKIIRDDFTQSGLLELGFTDIDVNEICLYKALGCHKCTNGYHGRVGLFEVLPISKTLGHLIMSGGNYLDILNTAKAEGMRSIYQSGLDKVKQGVTTIEELNRVTVD
jgi:type IV pilus assembly protein PilB